MTTPAIRMTIENAGNTDLLVTLDDVIHGHGQAMRFTVLLPYKGQTVSRLQHEAIQKARDLLNHMLENMGEQE